MTHTPTPDPTLQAEFAEKLGRVRKLMAAGNFSAVRFTKLGNLSWLLCGGDTLVSFADAPIAEAVVTPRRVLVLMQEVERDRLEQEAFPPGVEAVYYPWQDAQAKAALLGDLFAGGKVLSDAPGTAGTIADITIKDFWPLRIPLMASEVERYRALGRDAAQAFSGALRELTPGLSEHDVAARVAYALRERGLQPALILVAADARLQRYRHPLPTGAVFEDRVMVVTCARRHGLYANLTRLVSAQPLEPEARNAYERLLGVENTLFRYTQHGVLTRELFPELQRAYDDAGFVGEWARHHQGGACGYETRDFLLQENNDAMLVEGSAYAWNPSLPGLKVEDTMLLQGETLEVLTADPSWPSLEVGGYLRPDVLSLE